MVAKPTELQSEKSYHTLPRVAWGILFDVMVHDNEHMLNTARELCDKATEA